MCWLESALHFALEGHWTRGPKSTLFLSHRDKLRHVESVEGNLLEGPLSTTLLEHLNSLHRVPNQSPDSRLEHSPWWGAHNHRRPHRYATVVTFISYFHYQAKPGLPANSYESQFSPLETLRILGSRWKWWQLNFRVQLHLPSTYVPWEQGVPLEPSPTRNKLLLKPVKNYCSKQIRVARNLEAIVCLAIRTKLRASTVLKKKSRENRLITYNHICRTISTLDIILI